MYEEYCKKIDEKVYHEEKINDDYHIIFKYVLCDAWQVPIKSIIITSDKNNNTYLNDNEKTIETITVNNKKLETIFNKYVDQLEKLKVEEFPFTGVMDGYINEISFKVNEKWYQYNFYNIGFYTDEEIKKDKQLILLFTFLNELYDLFIKENNIISDYFVLVDENDFDEE